MQHTFNHLLNLKIYYLLAMCLNFACSNTQKPTDSNQHLPSPQQQNREASSSTPNSSPKIACSQVGHETFVGIVEQNGSNFVLKTEEKDIPLWAISRNEAVAPRSPDLSSVVGRQVRVCGNYDGSALYEAHLSSEQ